MSETEQHPDPPPVGPSSAVDHPDEVIEDRAGSVAFRIAWGAPALISAAILVFGLVQALLPGPGGSLFARATGLASVGVGLFGGMIALVPFRNHERWAWLTMWFYPVFWSVHLFGGLPPGQDHAHQVVFLALSVLALVLSAGAFFPLPRIGTVRMRTEEREQH